MKKLFGIVLGIFLLGVLFVEVQSAAAHNGNDTKPVTSPVTSSTQCKPGWGFGDKNHCHIKQNKHDNDGKHTNNNTKHDGDDHHDNDHHKPFISPISH